MLFHNLSSHQSNLISNQLSSKHKEPDPKVFLHTVFESDKGRDVCVVADDSDILILLLSASNTSKVKSASNRAKAQVKIA